MPLTRVEFLRGKCGILKEQTRELHWLESWSVRSIVSGPVIKKIAEKWGTEICNIE